MRLTSDEFYDSIIAQDDDNDYQESGYVIFNVNDIYYIASYGHDSCFGTFTDLCGGGMSDDLCEGEVSYIWSGTLEELKDMARRCADPHYPSRQAIESDSDFDHLQNVYVDILKM